MERAASAERLRGRADLHSCRSRTETQCSPQPRRDSEGLIWRPQPGSGAAAAGEGRIGGRKACGVSGTMRILAITNIKGGVGKTLPTSVNLSF